MSRRLVAAVALTLPACAPPSPMRIAARGTLAYAAAWGGERLVTVELTERFELVVRDGPGLRETARIDLGPPELDLRGLAVTGDLAVVGGDDGWLRRVDLASRRELDRWPQGAPITAVAASPALVAAGDAAGAVCVRRASGELLQCVVPGAGAPIEGLSIDGDRLAVRAGGARRVMALPSLRPVAAAAPAVTWRGGALRSRDRVVTWRGPRGVRRLAALAGPIRAIAVSKGGKLAIAGWVRRLDQPSVVIWLDPPR